MFVYVRACMCAHVCACVYACLCACVYMCEGWVGWGKGLSLCLRILACCFGFPIDWLMGVDCGATFCLVQSDKDIACVVVVDDKDKLVGLFTAKDFLRTIVRSVPPPISKNSDRTCCLCEGFCCVDKLVYLTHTTRMADAGWSKVDPHTHFC
jgi:hypothetical protein